MSVTIYHNPQCSKSRATLQLLLDNGIDPVIIEYLKTPPSSSELDDILHKLDIEPRDFMRKQEEGYKLAGLDSDELNRAALIQGMVDHPRLIERPIVLSNNKAAVGRPPEKVLEIL